MSGVVVWFTGRPASGKSTLAGALATRLRVHGRESLVLDGDQVRAALVPAHGYDDASRDAFYQTLGNLAALAAGQGLIAIVAATAHRRGWRDRVRQRAPRFVEVHVDTPLEECRRRDPRGLYADAPPDLPIDYEAPLAPEVVATPGDDDAALEAILAILGGGP